VTAPALGAAGRSTPHVEAPLAKEIGRLAG
jgi:hypothetical protein